MNTAIANQKCEFNPVEDRHIEPRTNWWGSGMLVRNGTNANNNAHETTLPSSPQWADVCEPPIEATGPTRLR